MAQALEIVESLDGGTHVLTLVGRLDADTSSQLGDVSRRLYAQGKAVDIVLDMGQCNFVSSAGLRVIIAMHKHAAVGGSLLMRGVTPNVMEVFTAMGFDRILSFE